MQMGDVAVPSTNLSRITGSLWVLVPLSAPESPVHHTRSAQARSRSCPAEPGRGGWRSGCWAPFCVLGDRAGPWLLVLSATPSFGPRKTNASHLSLTLLLKPGPWPLRAFESPAV